MFSKTTKDEDYDDGTVNLEVILQRIFNEQDAVAHRAAIWELFQLSGDWELYEKLHEFGGEKGIINYFQNVIDHLDSVGLIDEDEIDQPIAIPEEHRDAVRELYSSPIVCIRQGDWTGMAAAIHEILLTEIYDVYQINEESIPFGEATSSALGKWVSEEILFPLSIIEFMAYSDSLSGKMTQELLDNHLSLILTLFFSAQAHLDIEESEQGLGLEPGEDEEWKD